MSKWADPINQIIKIMLDLADLADEKKETPFGGELGLGCYTFSNYVRKGVKEIIDLRSKYYSANQRAEQYKSDLTNNEELLTEIFGTTDITEYPLSDDEKGRIKAVVRELEKEREDEAEYGAKMEENRK